MAIVDLVRTGTTEYRAFKTNRDREEAVLGLLEAYFLFLDCAVEGAQLINEAGPDPIGKIASMDALQAKATLERWDAIIVRQAARLRMLQGYVLGAHPLAVIDPELQERISDAVGNKMERADSLHAIGAALFFRAIFPIANTNEERARYVSVIAGSPADILNVQEINDEISGLKTSLDEFRKVVTHLVPPDDLLRLSDRARKAVSSLVQ